MSKTKIKNPETDFWDVDGWLWKDLDSDDELLIAYNRKPSDEMVSMCALCYQWFKSRDELHEHMVTHIHDSRFHECSICQRKFIARFLCARHEAMHRYDSNYPYCRYWGDADTLPLDFYVKNHPVKRFKPVPYSPYYLKQLRRLEKRAIAEPISCIGCSKVFSDHDSLQEHYDNNHAVHECIFCYEILESFQLYENHLRDEHDLETPTNHPGGLWGMLDEYVESLRSQREQMLENIRFFHNYASPYEEPPPKASTRTPIFKSRAPRSVRQSPSSSASPAKLQNKVIPAQTKPTTTTTTPTTTTTTTTPSSSSPPPPPPPIQISHNKSNEVVFNTDSSVEKMDVDGDQAPKESKSETSCDGEDLKKDAKVVGEEEEGKEREEEDELEELENEEDDDEEEEEYEGEELDNKSHPISTDDNDNDETASDIPNDQSQILEMSFDSEDITLSLTKDSILWVDDSPEESNIVYSCQICGKLFDNEKLYNRHRKLHNVPTEKNFDCQYCGKAFATHSNRKEHERIHSERPYSCPICDRGFIQISNLKKHIQTHKELNHLQCKICKKQFVKDSSLQLHQRAHATERKFKCDTCDRAYNYASLLKRHKRIHTGECPYQCVECNLPFHELVSLHYHRKKMHTHERPHKCNICGRGFILSSDLKKHHKVHLKREGAAATEAGFQNNTTSSTADPSPSENLEASTAPEASSSPHDPTMTTTTTTATTDDHSSPLTPSSSPPPPSPTPPTSHLLNNNNTNNSNHVSIVQ